MGFIMQIRPEVLKKLREDYPTGCRVELVQMFEEPRKDMVPGLTGEVMFVDDAGGIHVAWSNQKQWSLRAVKIRRHRFFRIKKLIIHFVFHRLYTTGRGIACGFSVIRLFSFSSVLKDLY